jgi:hypothetical protein
MKNLFFILITLLTLSSTSCKKWQHKYPEDTERSKDTPFERLTNKWWTLKTASINGIDYTDSVNTVYGTYRIYFGTSVYQHYPSGLTAYEGLISTNIEPVFSSVWSLYKDETILELGQLFGSHFSDFNILPVYNGSIKFDNYSHKILKLSESELKLTIFPNGIDTSITTHFIR